MSDLLYGRRARLTLSVPVPGSFKDTLRDELVIEGADAGDVPGLRLAFKVKKGHSSKTGSAKNTTEIIVTNLAPATRARLQQKGLRARLEAGYQATGLTTIFVGDIRTVDHAREDADWHTVLKAGDGERALLNARASASFAANTTLKQVVQDLAGALGLSLGPMSAAAEQALAKTLHTGWAAHGKARDELSRALRAVGLSWSVQDGLVQVLAAGESLPASIPEISSESGLIGSPEMGSPEAKGGASHLRFRSLLLPAVKPGVRVALRSERYKGQFRVLKLEHSGDTAGGNWYTDLETEAAA